MNPEFDVARLPPLAQKAIAPDTPLPMKMMAAKGLLPGAKPSDVVTVIVILGQSEIEEVVKTANTTLKNLPRPILDGAFADQLAAPVLRALAEQFYENPEFVEKLLRQSSVSGGCLEFLAERATERIGELIATNEQLMLANPRVIEKLYMNKRVRMSTADRLIELAVRNQIELGIPVFKEVAAAIRNELIPEPTPEPTIDDILFKDLDQVATQIAPGEIREDTHEVDAEGQEILKNQFLPLYQQIAQMTVTQKIRRAMLGTAAERLLLVRDSNRLVSTAVAKSPLLRENEAVLISASRAMSDDVLRTIAMNREFTRNYQIKYNLVTNPRTPFSFVSRLIPHLRDADLKGLVKSKNVTSSVVQAIRQQLERKKKS
jgi:hypothetical protein